MRVHTRRAAVTCCSGAKWEKRFCELVTSGSLFLYKKQGDTKPSATFFLKGNPSRIHPEDKTCIVLQAGAPSRVTCRPLTRADDKLQAFRCASEQEAQDWLNDLLFYS